MMLRSYFLCSLIATQLISGCATRYIQDDSDKAKSSDAIGDVVVFSSSKSFASDPPKCLGVMPIGVTNKEFAPTDLFRKAIHANLAPTGIALIPLQQIDKQYRAEISSADNLKSISLSTGCDTLISGEITERKRRFLGVYSDVTLGANLKITRVSNGEIMWTAKHTAVMRDGGLPLNPLSIISGSVTAGLNIREEQVVRNTNDLARRLVAAIPSLKYTELDADITAKTAQNSSVDNSSSVHSFLSSLQSLQIEEQRQTLIAALTQERWAASSDRLFISEYLLKQDPNNALGMFANSTARLELGQPQEALAMVNRLLLVDKVNAEYQFLKGRVLIQLNRPVEATEPLLKAAGIPNPKAIYFTALGVTYNQLGNYDIALAALSRSLEMQKNNPYVLIQQAVAYVGISDDKMAAESLKKSVVLSIVANDNRNANRAILLFKSMGLVEQLTAEDFTALEQKVATLSRMPQP
jgi:tetratricopeptide (TPR) repeat protein